jgi:hypothetical protein
LVCFPREGDLIVKDFFTLVKDFCRVCDTWVKFWVKLSCVGSLCEGRLTHREWLNHAGLRGVWVKLSLFLLCLRK